MMKYANTRCVQPRSMSSTTCVIGASHAKALVENSNFAHSFIAYTSNTISNIAYALEKIGQRKRIERILLFISPLTHRGRKQDNKYNFYRLNTEDVIEKIIHIVASCKRVTSKIAIVEGPPRGLTYPTHPWQQGYNQICYFLQHTSGITIIKWSTIVQAMCELPVGTRHIIESLGFQQYFQSRYMPDKVHCTKTIYIHWGQVICKLIFPKDDWSMGVVPAIGPLLL